MVDRFSETSSTFSMRKPENLDIYRAVSCTKDKLKKWYSDFQQFLKVHEKVRIQEDFGMQMIVVLHSVQTLGKSSPRRMFVIYIRLWVLQRNKLPHYVPVQQQVRSFLY